MCLLKTERQICIPAGNMHTLAISAFFIFLSWLCRVSAAAQGSSLVVPSRRYSLGVVLLTVGSFSSAERGHQEMRASAVVVPRLQVTGSTAAAHRLNCSTMRRIFPDQGSKPCLLHCQILYH